MRGVSSLPEARLNGMMGYGDVDRDVVDELAIEIGLVVLAHRPRNLIECWAGANTYAGERLAHWSDEIRAAAVERAVEWMKDLLGQVRARLH